MERVVRWGLAALMVGAFAAVPAGGQTPPPEPPPEGVSRFLHDVSGDYRQFFTLETTAWLPIGLGASFAVLAADQAVRDSEAQDRASSTLKGGQEFGGAVVQVPLALAWWIVGHAAGSDRESDAGRDLLRGQISAMSWTYAVEIRG